MFAFARFALMALVVCTVVYVSLWMYLRLRRRQLLEEDWRMDSQGQSLRDYQAQHLPEFDRQRRRLLVTLVYVLPISAIALIIYLTNFH